MGLKKIALHYFSIFWVIPLLLFFISCNKEKDFDCFKSTGNIVKASRLVPHFNKILLQGNIHLIFAPDSVQRIEIEAGENLIPKIITKVVNDSLILENRNYCNWVRSYEQEIKVYIHGNPQLMLYNIGYGNVSGKVIGESFFIKSWSNATTTLELNVKDLWIESFKLGNTFLSGSVENAQIFKHETGKIDMGKMSFCRNLIFHDHGQGKSIIRADHQLKILILDSGKVICITKPAILHVKDEIHNGSLVIPD